MNGHSGKVAPEPWRQSAAQGAIIHNISEGVNALSEDTLTSILLCMLQRAVIRSEYDQKRDFRRLVDVHVDVYLLVAVSKPWRARHQDKPDTGLHTGELQRASRLGKKSNKAICGFRRCHLRGQQW